MSVEVDRQIGLADFDARRQQLPAGTFDLQHHSSFSGQTQRPFFRNIAEFNCCRNSIGIRFGKGEEQPQ